MTEEPVRGAKLWLMKKTSRKSFAWLSPGSTVDGREISPVHLREAAENFNPDVYAACVNVEHYLSPCPSSEFSAMGDVTALSTEDITEGPLAGRTALYAEIEPTERMKQLCRGRQENLFQYRTAPAVLR